MCVFGVYLGVNYCVILQCQARFELIRVQSSIVSPRGVYSRQILPNPWRKDRPLSSAKKRRSHIDDESNKEANGRSLPSYRQEKSALSRSYIRNRLIRQTHLRDLKDVVVSFNSIMSEKSGADEKPTATLTAPTPRDVCPIPEEVTSPSDVPDGGLRAWVVLLGCWFTSERLSVVRPT